MNKLIILPLLFSWAVQAQKQTYDIVTHTPPKNWKKEITASACRYSFIKGKSWCTITIYKNTTSLGGVEKDFDKEWTDLAATPLKISAAPQTLDVMEADGWKIKTGSSPFSFNNADALAMLTTFSGYNARLSILVSTNSQEYSKTVEDFIASIELNNGKGNSGDNAAGQVVKNTPAAPAPSAVKGYAFTTTNFDDGWTSTIQEDWVEVTKGNIKILLHYPKEGTVFPADPDVLTNAAWNILVAPRYANLRNYKTAYISTYNRPYLGMGIVTNNQTGKDVFVFLFRKEGGWIEFITPDKNTFIQQFKFDPETIRWDSETSLLDPVSNMYRYNKFAIAASDFAGKWEDRFSSNTYYTNIYTGMSAGMSTYSSSQWYEFSPGQKFKWQLVAANSYGGNTNFAQAKGAGTFKVLNNWQIWFSDQEGKPKTYDAYFSATKGGRVLWMNDTQYKGSGIFTGFGQAK